jgi:hypothetical protein
MAAYKILLFGLLTVFIWSCQGEKVQESEIISLDDLISDKNIIEDTLVDFEFRGDKGEPEFSSITDQVTYALKGDYDTVALLKPHPFDRYGYTNASKVQYIGKNKIAYGKTNMLKPKAELFVYNFSDSTTLNNAFYNWLDCYGSDCNEVKLKQNIDKIKTPPEFTLVYDTVLVSVKYMCEHKKNDWKSFQDSVISKFGKDYRYRIDVECGGPLVWK